MDKDDEIIFGQSPTPTPAADMENDPVSESISTDDPDVRLHSSSQSRINPNGARYEECNRQECINDTAKTYFDNDSVADDSPNETFLENDAEIDEDANRVPVPNANDSSISIIKPSGTEDECMIFVNDSVNDDLPNETSSGNDIEIDEVSDRAPNTDDSLITSDSITETNKETKSDQKTEKISQFPLGRVRDIMKSDPDIKIVSAECVFLVAKATELFLQRLGSEIHAITLRNKKKTLQKKDLDAVISENVAFEFLDGALN